MIYVLAQLGPKGKKKPGKLMMLMHNYAFPVLKFLTIAYFSFEEKSCAWFSPTFTTMIEQPHVHSWYLALLTLALCV